MRRRHKTIMGLLFSGALATSAWSVQGQTGETFTGSATVKTAGNAAASVPVTIRVDRKMTPTEADTLVGAFKGGGASGLRKALEGVPPTGSVQIGAMKATPARLTIERPTEKGRLLTIVSDQPILFLGAGVPGARPKEGYDFAILDIEIDASGSGSGTLAPAAKVTVKGDAFVVEDYASELVRVTALKKVK